ncbi:MAG TPA: glycoside hydrolase family 30 beta sandwich domain-containing protein [Polyangia bacterium]|nr:glycoside hydrolase family 30 beta sandwich domain-containing protein [Polyangia bacterium]
MSAGARTVALALALLGVACTKQPPAGLVCPDGLVACGATCLDVGADPSNCGGCGIPCPADHLCTGGVCQCSGGLSDCNGSCLAPDAGAATACASDGAPALVTSAPGAYWQTGGALTAVAGGDVDVTVDDTASAQVWEGFGGAFNELGWTYLSLLSPADRAAALDLLYGADGARFVFGRIPIGASDYAVDRYTDDEVAAGTDEQLAGFSIDRDLTRLVPYVKAVQAVKPNVRLWASPWTPPTWMKQGPFSPGNMVNPFDGGSMKSDAATLAAYAQYLVKFVQAYAAQGIPLEAISAQNEPSYTGTYPTCAWTPSTYTTFVGRYLGPAVAAAGLATKIMLGTFNGGGSDRSIVGGVMGDAAARAAVDVLGYQWGMENDVGAARAYDLPVWQTEHECGNYPWETPFDAQAAPNDQAYAVETWGRIRDWIRAGVTAYSAWNMVLDTVGVGIDSTRVWPQNALLTVDTATATLNVTPAYYVFRHLSRFVAPGARVVAVRGGDALAFRNPGGGLVVVLYNAGAARMMTVEAAGQKLRFSMPAGGWATVSTGAPNVSP